MLNRDDWIRRVQEGLYLLDGAMGTNLIAAGMPRGCCAEQWALQHEEIVMDLQHRYAQAGSQILYAPTFRAHPLALSRFGLEKETEQINARLVQLSWKAAPDCLIAGDLTTMAGCTDPQNPANHELLVAGYRRQIRGIMDGGADLLVAETLLYRQEAFAIMEAADAEGAGAILYTFVLGRDGCLRSGESADALFPELQRRGAAALGVNCITADERLPELIAMLRSVTSLPLICKPNLGRTLGGEGVYPVTIGQFASVLVSCMEKGANLLGGCCGTMPAHIRLLKNRLTRMRSITIM